MSPAALLIIQLAQLAIANAPEIENAVLVAKNAITELFNSGVISADQQNLIHAHIDAIADAVRGGLTPPEFQVQPDPA